MADGQPPDTSRKTDPKQTRTTGASERMIRSQPPASAALPTAALPERGPLPCSSGDLFPAVGSCGFDRELQLKWNLGVFPPQGNERSGQPAPESAQFVDNRMASRTKGDQPGRGVATGTAMMNGALIRCPAALTTVAVASEDGVAMSAKAPARMRGLPIAAAAQAGNGGIRPAAAEQRRLCRFQQGSV